MGGKLMPKMILDGLEVQITEDELAEIRATTPEHKASSERYKRDFLLAETDWWAVADRTMTQAEIDYRQALRDVPAQAGFPENITWPTKP